MNKEGFLLEGWFSEIYIQAVDRLKALSLSSDYQVVSIEKKKIEMVGELDKARLKGSALISILTIRSMQRMDLSIGGTLYRLLHRIIVESFSMFSI